jgi:hypothetical protein
MSLSKSKFWVFKQLYTFFKESGSVVFSVNASAKPKLLRHLVRRRHRRRRPRLAERAQREEQGYVTNYTPPGACTKKTFYRRNLRIFAIS